MHITRWYDSHKMWNGLLTAFLWGLTASLGDNHVGKELSSTAPSSTGFLNDTFQAEIKLTNVFWMVYGWLALHDIKPKCLQSSETYFSNLVYKTRIWKFEPSNTKNSVFQELRDFREKIIFHYVVLLWVHILTKNV